MIVENMNGTELFNEIFVDFLHIDRIVLHKHNMVRRMMLKSRNKHIKYIFDYTTPRKNKSVVMMNMNKKDFTWVNLFYDTSNNFYMLNNFRNNITHYTPHFIRRYNERFLQSDLDVVGIMKRYIKENYQTSSKLTPTDMKCFGITSEGICLGEKNYIDTSFNGNQCGILTWKTFITFDMVKDYQVNDTIELNQMLETYRRKQLDEYGIV